jgi:hypothetical protein
VKTYWALAFLIILAPNPAIACSPDTVATWDAYHGAWGWETAFDLSVQYSHAGSQATIVGRIGATSSCGPMEGFNAGRPDSEITWVLEGMVSQGSSDSLLGPGGSVTRYTGGSFSIWESGPNAPLVQSMPPNPPTGTVPSTFEDGTLLYQASVGRLSVFLTKDPDGFLFGAFSADFTGTAGSILPSMPSGHVDGSWCYPAHDGTCGPPFGSFQYMGYTGFSKSGFIGTGSSTPIRRTTWGTLKTTYR